MKKILINDLGFLKGTNRVPIISKIKYWQMKGYSITFLCSEDAKENYEQFLKNINYITISKTEDPSNRIALIFEFIKRNIAGFKILEDTITNYDVFYSLSAVLDLLLIPYYFKFKKIKFNWCVVFDNTVSFKRPGDLFVGLLAYVFFELSLILLKKADYIYPIAPYLKEYLISRGFRAERLVVTGNAVEVDLIESIQADPTLKIDALFIGRVNETKGIYDLLDVLKLVTNTYPDFKLALMGKGDKEAENKFKRKVTELNLEKNVDLLGFKYGSEKFKYIKSSKMFLFLSPSESYGVALLEAVCSGLPALVYNLGIFSEIYTNNEIFMFEKGDFNSISTKIVNIMKTKQFINHAGSALLKRYDWGNIARLEMEVF